MRETGVEMAFMSRLATRERRFLPAAGDLAQALVILAAGRAAFEMRAHPGEELVGVIAGQLEVDVLVQQLEALVAADLGPIGAEQAGEQVAGVGRHVGLPSESAARSLCRASCNVLYRAPRVVLKRSARTSIGTPSRARATKTTRW